MAILIFFFMLYFNVFFSQKSKTTNGIRRQQKSSEKGDNQTTLVDRTDRLVPFVSEIYLFFFLKLDNLSNWEGL